MIVKKIPMAHGVQATQVLVPVYQLAVIVVKGYQIIPLIDETISPFEYEYEHEHE